MTRPRVSAFVILAAAAVAGPALADVLVIGDDGAVATLVGPAVHSDGEVVPIERLQPQRQAIAAATPYEPVFRRAADRYGLSADLVRTVAMRESRMRQSAVSPKGAIGLMQLMPGTAREMGVDPHDAEQNIMGGAAYLRLMLQRYDGDLALALAAYNAGPGAVDAHGGVPPFKETRRYVAAILADLGASESTVTKPR